MRKKGQSLPISIPKILLSFTLGVGAAVLFLLSYKSTKEKPQIEEINILTEVVLSAIPMIQERWTGGDIEGKWGSKDWTCRNLNHSESVAPAFLKCRPAYLECFARGQAGVSPVFKVIHEKNEYSVQLKALSDGRFGKWMTKKDLSDENLPASGLLIHLEVQGLGVWPVILEDVCRDQYLPQRFYSYGGRSERGENQFEMLWDNFGRTLFVDKFPVSKSDWYDWNQGEYPLDSALPVLNISVEEQENYCASRGARRLDVLIWDAATMTPPDLKRDRPQFITKPLLPWTRDRKGTFFEKALINPDWRPELSDCRKAYVKECATFPYRLHETDNTSWTGVSHVLGGVAEQMRNSVEPEFLFKSSTRFESARSPLHKLGKRIKDSKDFSFRCYKEIYP